LLANKLIDVLHIWTYPITLGKGKKLFQEGTPAQEWTITDSTITPTGIIIATYLPGGEVKLGSFESASISDREIARRKKWANEEKAK
jgi:dihydrofolate reductase